MMNLRLYIATWTLFCTCAAIPDVSNIILRNYPKTHILLIETQQRSVNALCTTLNNDK